MKKIIFLFVCMSMLLACNDVADKTGANEQAENEHSHSTVLSLNNGAKWKADSVINHNVIRLKNTADMFRIKPSPSASAYQLLGSDLANDADTMIQQCTMKGPDHEALHRWLEPILDQTNQLKNITDTAAARNIFDAVDKRIDEYYQYFE
jgi:hypothetical protein